MQLIEEESTNHQPVKAIILSANRAMINLSNSYVRCEAASPFMEKHTYQGKIFLTKVRRPVSVSWQCTFFKKTIYTQLRIDHYCSNDIVSKTLCQFFKSNTTETGDYIFRVNNLELSDKEGTFILNNKTGQLTYKAYVTGFTYITTQFKVQRFLRAKFGSLARTFANNIENIIFYYKLFRVDLLDLQAMFQRSNHVPLLQKVEKILLLKQLFECDRINRSKRSRINLKSGLNESVNQLAVFLLHKYNIRSDQSANRRSFSGDSIMKMKAQYEKEQSSLLKIFASFQSKKGDTEAVLTSIVITEKGKEKAIGEGGYACIFYAIYNFIPQLSIFETLSNTDQQDEAKEIKECGLVKKIGLKKEQNIALQNECAFLVFIRNKICPFFAKYFCNKSNVPFADGEIYLEYYPKTLGQCKLKQDDKLKVVIDVCMGLLFLSEENILHRDLKQFNIMVDSQKRGRLIDFGSVSNTYSSTKFKAKDTRLRSTQGYFVNYRQALKKYPNIQNLMSQSEYYTHRGFDLYSFGKILNNVFYLDNVVESQDFFRHNLKFLSMCCMEINPEDRWTIEQVIIFLKNLMQFEELRKQFWCEGFYNNINANNNDNSTKGVSQPNIGAKSMVK